jgi:hypothetical protein
MVRSIFEAGKVMKTKSTENNPGEVDQVESLINYMAPMDEKPRRYLCPPPPGSPEITWRSEQRLVSIYNCRAMDSECSLGAQGFTLQRHHSAVDDFYDEEQTSTIYYPEVERLVKDLTGAATVLIFDYNLRSSSRAVRSRTGAYPPAQFAHSDYTLSSGPQRVRDLLDPLTEERLRRRFLFLNLWRPINRPVEDDALAVCEAQSVSQSDLVATDLIYANRTGEIYNITFNPRHRWYYFPHMTPDEVLIFTCFDSSDPARANCVPHCAFHDPTAPPDAAPRESVEVRAVALF